MSNAAENITRMKKILTELKDVHDCQKALIEKTATIQMELSKAPDRKIEDALGAILSNQSSNSALIKQTIENYRSKICSQQI